jgi:hypothetical protein
MAINTPVYGDSIEKIVALNRLRAASEEGLSDDL